MGKNVTDNFVKKYSSSSVTYRYTIRNKNRFNAGQKTEQKVQNIL
jgi:hypothetical protein